MKEVNCSNSRKWGLRAGTIMKERCKSSCQLSTSRKPLAFLSALMYKTSTGFHLRVPEIPRKGEGGKSPNTLYWCSSISEKPSPLLLPRGFQGKVSCEPRQSQEEAKNQKHSDHHCICSWGPSHRVYILLQSHGACYQLEFPVRTNKRYADILSEEVYHGNWLPGLWRPRNSLVHNLQLRRLVVWFTLSLKNSAWDLGVLVPQAGEDGCLGSKGAVNLPFFHCFESDATYPHWRGQDFTQSRFKCQSLNKTLHRYNGNNDSPTT